MLNKCKNFMILAISAAMILTVFIAFPAYATETELILEETEVETEVETEEDNPVVEITEHGIVITKSCAEAIEKKLYMDDIEHGTAVLLEGDYITVRTSENITPPEFYQIEFVEKAEAITVGPIMYLYVVHFDPSLSVRERAALLAEDERVLSMSPPTGIPLDDDDTEGSTPIVFRDDDVSAYYHDALFWAFGSGIAKGYSGNVFGVGRACTRKDFLIFLWRMQGRPECGGAADSFKDMSAYSENTDTYKAISWAVSKGIVKGYKDGGFHPTETIKRKDVLIMMYRVARPTVTSEVIFPDVLSMGYSAGSDTYRAIAWASEKWITNGYSDGMFRPMENCLREECIMFLYREWIQEL